MSLAFPENNGWPYQTLDDSDYNLLRRQPDYSQLLAQKLADALGTGPPQPGDPIQDTGWLPMDPGDADYQPRDVGSSKPMKARLLRGVVHIQGAFEKTLGTLDAGDALGRLPAACPLPSDGGEVFDFLYANGISVPVRLIIRGNGNLEIRDTVSAANGWLNIRYAV